MDIALDPTTNDIALQSNGLYFVDGVDAIAQQLRITFQGFLGEWFLDTTLFMPWFQDVLIKAPSFAVVQEIFKNAILETQGILSLNDFQLNLDLGARTATLSFSALSANGPIDFSQAVQLPIINQVNIA